MTRRHFTKEEREFLKLRIDIPGCGGFKKYHCSLLGYKNDPDIILIGCEVNKKRRRGFQKAWLLMHKDTVSAWLEFKDRRTHNVAEDLRTWYEIAHKFKLWGDDISVEEENELKEQQNADCGELDTLNYTVDMVRDMLYGDFRPWEISTDARYDLISLYSDEFVA